MNDLDKKIQAALRGSTEGTTLIDEPNLAEELVTAFRGRNSWTNLIAVFFSVGFLAVGIWSGFLFFGAEIVREQLLWGGLCLFTLIFISFMKVWFWMEMHSNRVLREIKRVELLLISRER
ncbi:MAG: hypothetical protein J6386_08705 [Candidatus Synoicihabitans palmerolidicus]|nr:hypothetical protein [Candidatus Synoicihabitans palmerolidicus]